MLQFITHTSDLYSIPEEVQMALEGGCKWVQLSMKDATDSEIRDTAQELIPLCMEQSAFLVIEGKVELARELGVHGVHLGRKDMAPAEAREYLGPEAIIGVTVNNADEILALKGLDIDYVCLGPYRHASSALGIEGYLDIIDTVRCKGMDIPIVAFGGVDVTDIEALRMVHVNGVAISRAIIDSPDPVAYTRAVIDELETRLKNN